MTDLEQRLAKLQKQFQRLQIMGGEGVTIFGSPEKGYAVELRASTASSGEGGGPGPGPTPTGACCIDADCFVLSENGCVEVGGTYQGDDVSCDDVTCGACPDLNLCCQSITATATRCNMLFRGFIDDTFFRTFTFNDTWSVTTAGIPGPGDPVCYANGVFETVDTIDIDTCIDTTISCTTSGAWGGPAAGDCPYDDFTYDCADCAVDCDSGGNCASLDRCRDSISGCYNVNIIFTNTEEKDDTHCDVSGSDQLVETITQNLSDEYTEAEFFDSAVANLPAYPDCFGASGCNPNCYDDPEYAPLTGQGFDCSATRSGSLTGAGIGTIQRFRYQFKFLEATVNFTITWNEHTEFDDMTTADNPMTASVSISDTETSVFECLEPSTNGTTTITDIECSVD